MLEKEKTPDYYWVIAYCFILFLLCYFLQLIYIDYSIKIEKFYFTFPIKMLRFSSSFIFWVLLQPIIEVFISIFSCENEKHIVDRDMNCWQGIHLFYIGLFSVCLISVVTIALLISFFYNESRPYHTDAFSRLDSNFETYITLYRILITVMGHFLTST